MARFGTIVRGVLSFVLALTACRTVPAQRECPSVIIDPSAESRAALAEAVSQALNGARVKLADDALTKTDLLTIERELHRDSSGLPLNGRERRMPEQFRLVKAGEQCTLVHAGTGRRFPLAGVKCAPL
jgi:hypothetical protein